MKILLVLPRMNETKEINYNYTFPLGLCYISAILKKEGYDVDCLNTNHKTGTLDEIMKLELRKKNYDVVATGGIWFCYKAIKEIVDATRTHSPTSAIIVGGNIVTSDVSLAMNNLKPDVGIIGEGEEIIVELLKCIEENGTHYGVKGITFFSGDELVVTEQRVPMNDINTLPYPDLDGFEYGKYIDEMFTTQFYYNNFLDYPRSYSILGSRGCPFNCTFCYHSFKHRLRNVDSMIEELKWAIDRYKINIVSVNDDVFALDKKRLEEFCDKIKPLNLTWTCQLFVGSVDENILKKLKESGCRIISYGFESYDENVLKSMKKPITPQQIDFAFKETIKAGIAIQANFIFGDIVETKESVIKTLNYWKENCEGQVHLGFIHPYPGSEIFNYCVKKGIIIDKLNFASEASKKEQLVNMTDSITNEELLTLANELKRIKMSGFYKVSIPKYIIKTDRQDRYEVEIDCPFCRKTTIYKNYFLKEKTFYRDYVVCRNCNKRFYILKPT